MRLRRFSRVCVALWLGVIALAASAVEQNQLAVNVLQVAVAESSDAGQAGVSLHAHMASHVMPDGTVMAGTMGGQPADASNAHHPDAGGHTHKGHSDCELCGTVAAMAAFTMAMSPAVPSPRTLESPAPFSALYSQFSAAQPASYSSRAPPTLIS